MAIYDRSGRRSIPSTRMSLLLAAVAAIVLVLGIYSISHSVGPDANESSSAQRHEDPIR
jgi:hypothetical protein